MAAKRKGKRGGRRVGAGRKPNPEKKLLERLLNLSGDEIKPLDLMLKVVSDNTLPVELRMAAARFAAPYVHRRKPQAMEITGKFEFLSPEERQIRRAAIIQELRSRAAAAAQSPDPHAGDADPANATMATAAAAATHYTPGAPPRMDIHPNRN